MAGNVRELANAMERAMILAGDRGVITADTVSFLKTMPATTMGDMALELPAEGISLEELENNFIRQAIALSGNNQTMAARLLGLTRSKFRVLLRRAKKERKDR